MLTRKAAVEAAVEEGGVNGYFESLNFASFSCLRDLSLRESKRLLQLFCNCFATVVIAFVKK